MEPSWSGHTPILAFSQKNCFFLYNLGILHLCVPLHYFIPRYPTNPRILAFYSNGKWRPHWVWPGWHPWIHQNLHTIVFYSYFYQDLTHEYQLTLCNFFYKHRELFKVSPLLLFSIYQFYSLHLWPRQNHSWVITREHNEQAPLTEQTVLTKPFPTITNKIKHPNLLSLRRARDLKSKY